MRADFKPLTVSGTAVTDGAVFDASIYTNKWVQIIGTGTWSLDIEVSLDGTNYVKVQTAVTAAGLFEVKQTCRKLRIHTTSITGSPPTAEFGGLNTRSE